MKILISEQQLKRIISEQPESRFTPRGLTNKENMKALSGVNSSLRPNLDADDYTDIVSGLIDVIPGIGNLISGGIDITHGITYIVRSFYAKTIEDKVEMSIMALITFGTSFIPVGGNAVNLFAKNEIKMLLKKTPYEVLKIAKDMGLIKKSIFKLSKQAWKYSILIALVKIFRSRLDNVFGEVSKTLATIGSKSQELKPIMDTYINEIKEFQEIRRIELA
jgi:hypothetical protein